MIIRPVTGHRRVPPASTLPLLPHQPLRNTERLSSPILLVSSLITPEGNARAWTGENDKVTRTSRCPAMLRTPSGNRGYILTTTDILGLNLFKNYLLSLAQWA